MERKEKITKVGQPCRHCGTAVIKVVPRRKFRGRRLFYYEYYLRCPNRRCPVIGGAMYMLEECKRFWPEKPNH